MLLEGANHNEVIFPMLEVPAEEMVTTRTEESRISEIGAKICLMYAPTFATELRASPLVVSMVSIGPIDLAYRHSSHPPGMSMSIFRSRA